MLNKVSDWSSQSVCEVHNDFLDLQSCAVLGANLASGDSMQV